LPIPPKLTNPGSMRPTRRERVGEIFMFQSLEFVTVLILSQPLMRTKKLPIQPRLTSRGLMPVSEGLAS
jgi:hypothetical protein